jgi:hypothetical protein
LHPGSLGHFAVGADDRLRAGPRVEKPVQVSAQLWRSGRKTILRQFVEQLDVGFVSEPLLTTRRRLSCVEVGIWNVYGTALEIAQERR